jgi:hypothetical protein
MRPASPTRPQPSFARPGGMTLDAGHIAPIAAGHALAARGGGYAGGQAQQVRRARSQATSRYIGANCGR